jgi:hypothetical protein
MLRLESWEPEKPPIIRIIAQMLAVSAVNCFEILTNVRNNKILDPFKIPNPSEWFSFYQKHRYLYNYLAETFLNFDGLPAIYANTCKLFLQKNNNSEKNITKVKDQTKHLEKIFEIQLKHIEDDIDNAPLNEQEKEIVLKKVVSPEFLFLMSVAFPCWFLYQEYHVHIYRKARSGNIESIEKLLRLDKNIIQHPRINKWITYYSYQEDKRASERLSEAINKPPRSKIALAKEKYRIAGFISLLTELLGSRLSAPEIQSLFDAVAMDYGIDELRDPNLPDSPEAFEKAVRRERENWKKTLPSNRTKIS